jgi:UDP-N-acetyl-D-mannosaminuronic acid dehydrogenase
MSATDQNQKQHRQQYQDMESLFSKILVIGLGQLGLSVVKYVKEKGFEVYGYDISSKAINRAEKIADIKQAIDFGSEDFDVFIISVSTHQPDDVFSPQIEGLWSIAHKISK